MLVPVLVEGMAHVLVPVLVYGMARGRCACSFPSTEHGTAAPRSLPNQFDRVESLAARIMGGKSGIPAVMRG
ncbi:MAG: hypothetical protein ACJ78V_00125, partial [Myxococcales bacterium]